MHPGNDPGKQLLQAKANEHRHNDDGSVEEQLPQVHRNELAGVELGEQRGHGDGGEGGAHGHGNGKGEIGAGKIGDKVGSRAARATGHQNQPGGKFIAEIQQVGDTPAQERHDEILCGESHGDGPRGILHAAEILKRQRDTHAQHDERQPGRC